MYMHLSLCSSMITITFVDKYYSSISHLLCEHRLLYFQTRCWTNSLHIDLMSRNLIIEFLTSSLAIDINRSLSTVIFIIDASFNDASSFELSSIDIWLSHHYDFPRANPVIKTRSIQYMSPRKLVLGQHTIDISCWYSNG